MMHLNHPLSHKQRGFTLVELAISLVVIGLLMGGVLKGYELVQNTKIKKVVQEIGQIEIAVRVFTDKYGNLPGNIENPSFQLPNCTSTICNARYSATNAITTTNDQRRFWLHLDRAGLIKGVEEDGSTVSGPLNALGGRFHTAFTTVDSLTRSIIYISDKSTETFIKLRTIEILDGQIDDGKPLTGMARMQTSTAGCVDVANNAFGTQKTLRCQLFIHPNYMNYLQF